MILNDRYANVEPPGSSYLTAFTDLIGNLTYDDANNIADAYFMGYIPYDEMPDVLGVSLSTVDNGNVSFTDACAIENVPWFFVGKYSTNASNRYENGTFIYNPSTEKMELRDTAQSRGQYGFLNSASIQSLTSGGNITIHFTCYMTQSDGTYVNWWNSTSNTWLDYTLTPDEFFGFMKGVNSITFSINKEGVNTSFDIYYDDIKEGHYLYVHEGTGKKITVFITYFSLPHDYRDVNSNDNTSYFSCVYGAILRHVNHPEYGMVPYITNEFVTHFGYSESDNNFITWNGTSLGNRYQLYPDSGLCMGGWKCNIPASFWNTPNETTEIFGNCVVTHRTGGNNSRIYRMFTPDEINRTLLLRFTRICADNVGIHYGYRARIYYPLFNEDNSPKWEWRDGTFDELVSVLRPWQMSNITLNEFTPEDIPEYVPPVPDDRVSGSWLTNSDLVNFGNASGFVTQYVITAQQLANLGSYLWADFFDPDFLASMKVAVLEAGSLNSSDILNYIVSIRKYPLDIAGATYDLGFTSQFYIGRGCKGIKLDNGTNTIGILPNFAHNLRTGWTTIPTIYGDFRDYEPNTRIIVYVPFCGEVELTPSQAINSEIRLEYCIDFSNGSVECAVALRPKESPGNRYIAHTLTGSMGANVQLSASNLSQVLQKGLGLAWNTIGKVTGTAIAAGGTVAGLQASEAEYGADISESTTSAGDYMAGRRYNARNLKILGSSPNLPTFQGMQGTPSPTFGVSSGFSSFLVLTPNIQVQYRLYEDPSNYGHVCGYACNKTMKLGDLEGKGFTVCRNPDLSGVPATYDELVALRALLESGVYL